jgi:hypothetical protein
MNQEERKKKVSLPFPHITSCLLTLIVPCSEAKGDPGKYRKSD